MWRGSSVPHLFPLDQCRCIYLVSFWYPSFALEWQKAIQKKVDKLLKAEFVWEVYYLEWLAIIVLVKKANGKWYACIDYINLNQTCPKDSYHLSRIDQLVDATSGHQLLSFIDAFSEYNQIWMAPKDEEKTSFVTDQDLFCYKITSLGLKNASATY